MGDKKGAKMIVSIVERGQGKAVAKMLQEQNISFHYQCSGVGTAPSDLLEILGIGSPERDILLSLASDTIADRAMEQMINDEFQGKVHAKGIVFDISVTALNQVIATILFAAEKSGEPDGGIRMEQNGKHSLILVTVNQGHTDDVMDTAKKAGARGGTVIRARWAGNEESEKVYGITVQQEKEVIAIVAAGERRKAIMEAINEKHGLTSQAGAMLCSLGIDQMARLS